MRHIARITLFAIMSFAFYVVAACLFHDSFTPLDAAAIAAAMHMLAACLRFDAVLICLPCYYAYDGAPLTRR